MELSQVTQNYNRVARHYDRLVDIVFGRILRLEQYRGRVIDLLGDIHGATVLDIGCGTGRNFPLLFERVGPQGRIIGVDYSEGMLAQAQRRVQTEGWANIELMHGDAARLVGISEHVDAVIAVWCLGIVHDLDSAMRRLVDLLDAGGRIAIMDFGKSRPDHGLLRWLYPVYSIALRKAGIDSEEDLNNERLQAKWTSGKDILHEGLGGFHEATYLNGAGLIIVARKPSD